MDTAQAGDRAPLSVATAPGGVQHGPVFPPLCGGCSQAYAGEASCRASPTMVVGMRSWNSARGAPPTLLHARGAASVRRVGYEHTLGPPLGSAPSPGA